MDDGFAKQLELWGALSGWPFFLPSDRAWYVYPSLHYSNTALPSSMMILLSHSSRDTCERPNKHALPSDLRSNMDSIFFASRVTSRTDSSFSQIYRCISPSTACQSRSIPKTIFFVLYVLTSRPLFTFPYIPQML